MAPRVLGTGPFAWGDSVRVLADAPSAYHPNSLGSVCGTAVLKDEDRARALGEAVGINLYLVEFADGLTVEIPESWLEAIAEDPANS